MSKPTICWRRSRSTACSTRPILACSTCSRFPLNELVDMNEFELINRLTPLLPVNESVVVGAGDDCAVLDVGLADQWLLFKTDAVVEGIHFTKSAPPEKIGHKALGRCLSDVAAMAGTPTAALVT